MLFRSNYALGLLRSKKEVEAVGVLDSLLVPGAIDMELQEDVALGIGWALDAHCSVANREAICRRSSEEAYQKALEANPNSAKARLGLGLFRLRKGGVKSAETDFKAFLDMAAELEYPNRVVNFRKLSNQDFYSFVHSQIVELESTSQSLKVQQPPVIMAVDGVVSCILGRNSEAGKILEGALSNAPGDVSILKAFGYLRWREGQMNELVETLKDLRERGSFALNLMLGKAYWKLRKKEFAEKYAKALIEFSDRSEGMALSGELLMDLPEKQQEAKAAFQSALKIDPLDLTALRGMQRISPQAAIQPDLLKKLPF